jgi:hypothetical protein
MINDLAAKCSVTAPVWTVTKRRGCVQPIPGIVLRRETGEGWPLMTVETEANGDLWSTNERGSSTVGSLGCRAGKRHFYSAYVALVSPVQMFFSSPHTFSLCPHPWAGSRAWSPVF